MVPEANFGDGDGRSHAADPEGKIQHALQKSVIGGRGGCSLTLRRGYK